MFVIGSMNSVKKKLKRLFLWEFIALVAIVLLAFVTQQETKSIALGCLIFFIPNSFFAWRAFRFQGAKYAKEMVSSFYLGQSSKFLLTIFLFAIAFKVLQPINAQTLFVTFIAAFIGHQIALLKIMQAK